MSCVAREQPVPNKLAVHMAEPMQDTGVEPYADFSSSGDNCSSKGETKGGNPQWNPIEVYAVVKASLSASESKQQQSLPMLESLAQIKYSSFVVHLAAEEKTWPTLSGKYAGWTPEKSGEVRGHMAAPKLFRKFRDIYKPHMINVINPALISLLNQDHSIPSGKNKDEIISDLKKVLYDEDKKRKDNAAEARAPLKTSKKRKLESFAGANDQQHDDAASEANVKKMIEEAPQVEKLNKLRETYDGGPVFLAWLRLGPLSDKPEASFALSAKDTPPPAPGGRKAQREGQSGQMQELKAAAAIATAEDQAYKIAKVTALRVMGDAHKLSADVRSFQAKELSRTVLIAEKKALLDALDKTSERDEWDEARQEYIKALRAPRPVMAGAGAE